jgi:threonine/homoserine/homoserine lactone efflux protein
VGRALALGRRAALATVVGNAGELAVQLAMVVEGVGSIVTESEPVFTAIRVAGAAYLIVLGVRVVRDRRRRQSGLRKEGEPGCQARW